MNMCKIVVNVCELCGNIYEFVITCVNFEVNVCEMCCNLCEMVVNVGEFAVNVCECVMKV